MGILRRSGNKYPGVINGTSRLSRERDIFLFNSNGNELYFPIFHNLRVSPATTVQMSTKTDPTHAFFPKGIRAAEYRCVVNVSSLYRN